MRTTASIGSTLAVLAAANVLAHRVVPRASAVVAAATAAGLTVIVRRAGLTAADLGLDRSGRRCCGWVGRCWSPRSAG